MKAIGYVCCTVCDVVQRGYPPRGWKPGEELCTWQHRIGGMEDGGSRTRCEGSYKPGTNTRLDTFLANIAPS